ncbi:hypothetical protein [Conchiformibius steedae]|nr:hypothetical protein H3L98_10380 [Conchiformibius steedae]
MMNYREQVQRVLSIYHARAELGLSRSREQETFARLVYGLLKRNQIPFNWHLNRDFDAVFTVSRQHAGSLKRLFEPHTLAFEQGGAVLSQYGQDGIQVRFAWAERGKA